MSVTLLLGNHLAAWLLSFCAKHNCPHVCHSTAWKSSGCMAAVILCKTQLPTCLSLYCLEIIWLHGCCHSVQKTTAHMSVTLLLGNHLAAWLLSFCAKNNCTHVCH